jgi:hypothetical protein
MASEAPTLGLLAGPAIGSSGLGATADPQGSTLYISGGGYRGALFHLGALTRLNELGLLAELDTIGAAGGGSILAVLLASQVPWPLRGPYGDWPDAVAATMREIAAGAPIGGRSSDSTREERYARELAASLGGRLPDRPRFVIGRAGLSLAEIGVDDGGGAISWKIHDTAGWPGYDEALVEDVIAAVRTDLDTFEEAEVAVLENHGYLLADAALREHEVPAVDSLPPTPPFPRWMDEARVRVALAASSRRTRLGRLRHRSGDH